MKFNYKIRLRVLSMLVLVVGIFFVARLFYLQIVRGDYFALEVDTKYINQEELLFDRGAIYFTRKDGVLVPGATNKQEVEITADPQVINNTELVYQELNKVIPLDHEEAIAKLNNKQSVYEVLASKVDIKTGRKIKELNLKGIFIEEKKRRYYPAGPLAAHVLGYMAKSASEDRYAGRYGLEAQYEDILRHDTANSFANFFAELFLGFGKKILKQEGRQGNLVLTIEPIVQANLEAELDQLMETWQIESGGAIVMEPKTGKILAMASVPDFDPTGPVADISVLPNPLIQRVYEMGSVVKALTMASGLDAEAVTPETTYYDAGFLVLNNKTISNYDGKGRGTVNMQEVLNQSLNTGVTFVAQKMGYQTFENYMMDFGLGEDTGIDLPNERSSQIDNLKHYRDIEIANASFGQGIAITPLQMTRAFAVLANGGYLVKPYIVQKIKYDDGADTIIEPVIGRRVIKTETANTITRMLTNVVDVALVGGKYKMTHYSIAAKTGTAEIFKETGGYYDDRYLHSFFGYYPALSPRFVTFIYIVNPKGVRYSSETLSEPFMNLAEFLLNYYEVPPDR